MMLDSTPGNILTTKQVEPKVPTGTGSGSKQDSSRQNPSNCPQAEVRLVVKFIVEEQIVYNGKIERVQQLNIEELSRVVSRVAWNEFDQDDSVQLKLTAIDAATQTTETDVTSEEAGPSRDNLSAHNVQNPSTIKQAQNPTPTARHRAHATTSHQEQPPNRSESPFAQAGCSRTCPPETVSHDIRSIAQSREPPNQENIPIAQECDTNLGRCFVGEGSKTEVERVQESRFDREVQRRIFMDSNVNDANNLGNHSEHSTTSNDDTCIDSQSITDALNACVSRVDMECRLQEILMTPASVTNDEESKDELVETLVKISPLKHNEWDKPTSYNKIESIKSSMQHQENVKSERKVTRTAGPRDRSHSGIANSKQSHQVNDLRAQMDPSEKSIVGAATSKRRSSDNSNSTGKRIRSTASKDNRTLSTRSRLSESSESRIDKDANKNPSTDSPLSTNSTIGSPRQNKIFAKWTDNHFYPGTILKQARDRKYLIGFFDGAQRTVPEADLIPLRNIQGRQVRVATGKDLCVNARVHEQISPVENDKPMFDVEWYQATVKVRKSVPLADIFLTSEQGTLVLNQQDKNSGNSSNFADVDLDNIIYEKRSRRLQDIDDLELAENSSTTPTPASAVKRKRTYIRNPSNKVKNNQMTNDAPGNSGSDGDKLGSNNISNQQEGEGASSLEALKGSLTCPNSNSPSEGSSSTNSSNAATNSLDLGQEFYFASSSPHRTKTSVLL